MALPTKREDMQNPMTQQLRFQFYYPPPKCMMNLKTCEGSHTHKNACFLIPYINFKQSQTKTNNLQRLKLNG